MCKITIDWSYPVDLDTASYEQNENTIGIYYITRKFGNKVTDLYIKKTIGNSKSMLQCQRYFLPDTGQGKRQVRLGTIVKPDDLSEIEKIQLIQEVESSLLYVMLDKLQCNKQIISNINISDRHTILNTGYRGNIPEEIVFPEEYWIKKHKLDYNYT